MAWGNPVSDLRTFLNDGANNRFVKDVRVFPTNDGQTTRFFTYDDRLVSGTLTALVDSAEDATASPNSYTITITDAVKGWFTITPAPPPIPVRITASYYYQLWLDGELQTFLDSAATQVGGTAATLTDTAENLRPAVLHFAASAALDFAANRWLERKTSQFVVEEKPPEGGSSRADAFRTMGKGYWEKAQTLRDDVYTRQSRREAPAYGRILPRVRGWTPQR